MENTTFAELINITLNVQGRPVVIRKLAERLLEELTTQQRRAYTLMQNVC
jgi:hypothetical protein